MIMSISDVKSYLRVEYNDDDELIHNWIKTAESIIKDTLRTESLPETELNKTALLYAVAYLYEHRESANMSELMKNVRGILCTTRAVSF